MNKIFNMNNELFKKIISHAKEYGFVFQSSEIYDGLASVYDYGQYGSEMKKNLKDYWWRSMVHFNENIVGIDAAIFMHPKVWKASGHIDAFNDALIDNKDSKKRYRIDTLLEDYIYKIEKKINKEISKAKKRFGKNFDKQKFFSTNPKILRYKNTINSVKTRMNNALKNKNLQELFNLIKEFDIADPETGSKNWTEVRFFNLMFSTKIGAVAEESETIFLRPETAQGIFVNFLNIYKTSRLKIPFGIAQIGKAFRNEIVARQFIFRMREFEQMEMQFFVKPGTEKYWYNHWKKERMKWHLSLGIEKENFRFYEHENLAHYANAASDIEFKFPIGFKELEGIHSRTDYDLKQHEKFSGKKIRYYDAEQKESYIPYVIETSLGLDRLFLAILCNAYNEETLSDGSSRIVLKIPPIVAPVKIAVLPLVKRDKLPEIARSIFNDLKKHFYCQYDEKDTIGRRYRRQDAIGTPFCITVDEQTKEDNTVTIRERDSMKQIRIKIPDIIKYFSSLFTTE